MQMEAMVLLCDVRWIRIVDFANNFMNTSIFDLIDNVALTLDDTMLQCKWRNEYCDFFHPTLTEEGVCFTFNALNFRDIYTDQMAHEMMTVKDNANATNWNLENGCDDTFRNSADSYPYRQFGAGAKAGLFAMLQMHEKDMEYLCRGPTQSFNILLHTPREVPQVSQHFLRVPLLQEVLISVKPNMITTSDGLRHYAPNQRHCFFDTKRQLRFFKVYTQRNCELECLSNFTKLECGCVKLSMPRDRDTKICGAAQIPCYNKAEIMLLKEDFTHDATGGASRGCNCLLACTSIIYDAEISQAKFDLEKLSMAQQNGDEEPGTQAASFTIFFFSFYFTLRLVCTLKMRRSCKRKSTKRRGDIVAPAELSVPRLMVITPMEDFPN